VKHSYSQRITIHNTKPIGVEGLRITDNIPVSQDANITINLIGPALTAPASSSTAKAAVLPPSVKVSEGIVAQWSEADDPDADISVLGEYGHFDWICNVPAHGKVNLTLEYEVSTIEKGRIFGL